MEPTNKTARFAGFLYLLLVLVAPLYLLYMPGKIIVRGNASATAKNILANEMLFRWSIVAELLTIVIVTYLVMILYRLFNRVDKMQAALLVILGAVMSGPITFLNAVNELAALTLVRGPAYLQTFDPSRREALALFFLGLHGNGIAVVEIFWGLWLFPFGILVIRSRFIPRIFGVLLIINGIAYLVASFTSLAFPAYSNVVNQWAMIPETGELWIMLWLLIKGAKVEP